MDVTALMRALPPITYLPCSGPHYPTWPQQPWPGYFIWSAPGTTAFGLIDNMTVVS